GTRATVGCCHGRVGHPRPAMPFLREMNPSAKTVADSRLPVPSFAKGLLVALVAASAVALLLASRIVPVGLVRVFNGDYLAVFLFLTGLLLLAVFYQSVPPWQPQLPPVLAWASASALVLVLLFAGWFELTFYEAWLTVARSIRFPLLLVLLLPWHLAEEILIGPPASSPDFGRLGKAF